MKVLVTGASGFVGKHLLATNTENFEITTLSLQQDNWMDTSFEGLDAIVHLAGKAHQMTPIANDIYFKVNFELTKALAEKAQREGVKQFIYISSTKVYGDGNYDDLNENSPCLPTDAYGQSKLKAEFFLQTLPLPVAIVRPPLVYGKGVKGNMQKIITLCKKRSYLPFGNINNKRSMVYVGNLIALINHILLQSATGIFVAGDNKVVSTTELVKTIASTLNKKINLIAIPNIFRVLLRKFKPDLYTRLFGNFVVDNSITNKQLNFQPPYSFEQGIAATLN
jgi:UDP-glucose 4-epimerase